MISTPPLADTLRQWEQLERQQAAQGMDRQHGCQRNGVTRSVANTARTSLLLLLLLLAAAPLRACDSVLTQCIKEPGGSTVAMGECYGRHIESAASFTSQPIRRLAVMP